MITNPDVSFPLPLHLRELPQPFHSALGNWANTTGPAYFAKVPEWYIFKTVLKYAPVNLKVTQKTPRWCNCSARRNCSVHWWERRHYSFFTLHEEEWSIFSSASLLALLAQQCTQNPGMHLTLGNPDDRYDQSDLADQNGRRKWISVNLYNHQNDVVKKPLIISNRFVKAELYSPALLL